MLREEAHILGRRRRHGLSGWESEDIPCSPLHIPDPVGRVYDAAPAPADVAQGCTECQQGQDLRGPRQHALPAPNHGLPVGVEVCQGFVGGLRSSGAVLRLGRAAEVSSFLLEKGC